MFALKFIFIWLLVNKLSLVYSAELKFESSECDGPKIKGADCERGEIRFSSRHKRSTTNEIPAFVKAFGKEIYLSLTERESAFFSPATPVYRIFRAAGGTYRVDGNNDMSLYAKAKIFEDINHSASVTVDVHPDGNEYVKEGYIGSANLYFMWDPQNQKYNFHQFSDKVNDQYYEVNHKSPEARAYNSPTYLYYPYSNYYQLVPQESTIPEIIYPEILVVVDYEMLNEIHEDHILMYVIHRWNLVDMVYRGLRSPAIKFSIAGIILPMSPDSLQYFSDGSYYTNNRKNIDMNTSLNSFKRWLFLHNHIIPINSYDLAVTMLSKRPEPNSNQGWSIFNPQRGAAYPGSACEIDYYRQEVVKAAIVMDAGVYVDIIAAAHEVAHSLGADHTDGICNGPPNYIMEKVIKHSSRVVEWSQCTVEAFQNFLRKNPTCLYNKPKF
ncbi:GSCOCG00006052001-RA-CDS [Cotesia congregata]|nr:GSCOCG00006052001-RA-CDS [Cotesia congregata]